MADSKISSEAGSQFLGVPPEIRRQIYRILLLDPPESFLSTPCMPWYQQGLFQAKVKKDGTDNEMWHDTEYQGNFYEHNYNESDSEKDFPFCDSSSKTRIAEAPRLGESKLQNGHNSVQKDGADQEMNVQRFPAILRTNRQIYSEASPLLYRELNMRLQPGDVLCMKSGKDIVKASERVWRHNPLQDTGVLKPNGLTVYAKPELDGVMEPHVLARFKKITFDLDINWESETLDAETGRQTAGDQDKTAPSLFVNDNMTVNSQDEARLLAFYRRSTILHQLVKILSNSPDIVRLEILFDIEVLARYDMRSDSDSEDEQVDKDPARKMIAANERAMELFLDSGLLAPLEKLSNVRSFEFEYAALNCDCEHYKPKPKYARMLSDLKQNVERNYAVKND